MWLIYALISAISAALVTIFAKIGLKQIDSTLATIIRSIIMALFLVSIGFISKKINSTSISNLNSKDWLFIILSGIAGAVSWLFYFLALKSGTASKVAVIDKTSIIFIILLSFLFLKETFHPINIFGILLLIVGTLFILI